jgi:hypothetical protein
VFSGTPIDGDEVDIEEAGGALEVLVEAMQASVKERACCGDRPGVPRDWEAAIANTIWS